MTDPSIVFEQILKRPGLLPEDIEFLRTVWTELGRANRDVITLLANLRCLEELTGERLEDEDAAIVNQIEAERKPYVQEAELPFNQ